ncbi:hypothetical protein Vadar_011647 [Vaccinium darrowii]|uniref:Uncharacterized protein n=1 Tax=Vaccinium darrowii TaxID=229202 RepID=A0ACB7YKY0_9ERIC|nr:hypothetical protein Vadar_011647 [Vaccinium darrowii]
MEEAITVIGSAGAAREYNGKLTRYAVLSCTMAAMGGFIFGYDFGISGGVTSMEPFLKKFFPEVYTKIKEDTKISNYCKFDNQLLTSFTSSLYAAGLIASFFASSFSQAFGHRHSILVGGIACFAGAALGGAAFNVYMLFFSRVLLGVGVGFVNQSVPLYLSEMAPPKYRGAINSGFPFNANIGAILANLINYGTEKIKGGWGWRISLAMAAVPGAILTLGALFLPETPNSLIQRNTHPQAAKSMLQRIRGTQDVQSELDDLIKAGEISKTIKHPFKTIVQKKYSMGIGESASLMAAVVLGVVSAGSNFIAMLIVDKLGRRVLLMAGGIQVLVSQVMIGVVLATQLGDHGGVSKGYSILVLVLICVYLAGFGWSWSPLGVLIPSEIFPLEIRSAGQSRGWVVFMTVFVYLFLPETNNVPIEQMDRVLWREHWL